MLRVFSDYQGTQTLYELSVLGGRLDAVELGTSARHAVGSEVTVVLPPLAVLGLSGGGRRRVGVGPRALREFVSFRACFFTRPGAGPA